MRYGQLCLFVFFSSFSFFSWAEILSAPSDLDGTSHVQSVSQEQGLESSDSLENSDSEPQVQLKAIRKPSVIETLPIRRPISKFNESSTSLESQSLTMNLEGRQRISDYCHLVMINLGWISCGEVQVMTSSTLEPMRVSATKDDHQVLEWGTEEQKDLMQRIETETITRLDAQSEELDLPIFFQGWMIQPQLTPNHRYVYFATHSLWYNQQVIHLQAQTLDGSSFLMISIETPDHEKNIDEHSALRLIYQIMIYHEDLVTPTHAKR